MDFRVKPENDSAVGKPRRPLPPFPSPPPALHLPHGFLARLRQAPGPHHRGHAA